MMENNPLTLNACENKEDNTQSVQVTSITQFCCYIEDIGTVNAFECLRNEDSSYLKSIYRLYSLLKKQTLKRILFFLSRLNILIFLLILGIFFGGISVLVCMRWLELDITYKTSCRNHTCFLQDFVVRERKNVMQFSYKKFQKTN